MKGYYELVIKALQERGFYRIGAAKGSHEKWGNGSLVVIVPFNCYSRHTANGVLKDAGISKKF